MAFYSIALTGLPALYGLVLLSLPHRVPALFTAFTLGHHHEQLHSGSGIRKRRAFLPFVCRRIIYALISCREVDKAAGQQVEAGALLIRKQTLQ
jgi:hypothetical protein